MLDETGLRRPEFRPDVGITLADGQVWFLPKPKVKLRRKSNPDGTHRLISEYRLGEGYTSILETYEKCIETGEGLALAMFNLAASLLDGNYQLSNEEIDGLLEFDVDNPASQETWQVIVATGRGQVPNAPSGSGDDQE